MRLDYDDGKQEDRADGVRGDSERIVTETWTQRIFIVTGVTFAHLTNKGCHKQSREIGRTSLRLYGKGSEVGIDKIFIENVLVQGERAGEQQGTPLMPGMKAQSRGQDKIILVIWQAHVDGVYVARISLTSISILSNIPRTGLLSVILAGFKVVPVIDVRRIVQKTTSTIAIKSRKRSALGTVVPKACGASGILTTAGLESSEGEYGEARSYLAMYYGKFNARLEIME
ncbi:hypothetical protein DL96DRAFT_1562201 [Flagelloscypha sp. PMI_526]|nr:hypothetical protein DL96DRAFT_1562201 [Flagelloscypha sp. PMI_526]